MKNSVTIAKAFVIRKFFKNKVSEIENAIRQAPKVTDITQSTDSHSTKLLDNLIEKLSKAQDLLVKINTEIDAANSTFVNDISPRSIINKIEALKVKKELYEKLEEDVNRFVPSKTIFDEYVFNPDTKELGRLVEKNYKLNFSFDVKQALTEVKKDIRKSEQSLSILNSETLIKTSMDYWDAAMDELDKPIQLPTE